MNMALTGIKLLHTLVWGFFVACILGIPVAAWQGRFGLATGLIAVVLLECVVLAFNRGSCPLTGVAARYTDHRPDNFDIYLPLWLARYNKLIFGLIYASGIAYTAFAWW
jgi:hypothetical protein